MSAATGDTSSPLPVNSVAMREAEQAFRQAYPAFASTSALDDLRAKEYARLDDRGQIYLDYTGGGLYAESQLREHFDLLRKNVFGNPHSLNPTSRATTELVERARASVLDFFHASSDEDAVIFTANASQALKLVGEAYPFQPGGQFLLLFDNHNSVNGIREFARAKGAAFTYLPVMAPDLCVEEALPLSALEQGRNTAQHLFACPALILQDVRISDGCGLPAGAQSGSLHLTPSLVCRWDGLGHLGARRWLRPPFRRRGV
jgi:selenocysteine lyase/cysteine desulfurase